VTRTGRSAIRGADQRWKARPSYREEPGPGTGRFGVATVVPWRLPSRSRPAVRAEVEESHSASSACMRSSAPRSAAMHTPLAEVAVITGAS
jgi:hypothetical protein